MRHVLLLLIIALPVAAEAERERPKADAERPRVEAKHEAHDAMTAGTSGISTGEIVGRDGAKLLVRTDEGVLLFMPHWRGGLPKDGGGLDAAMRQRLEAFRPGQRVTIRWVWQERRRIEAIELAAAAR